MEPPTAPFALRKRPRRRPVHKSSSGCAQCKARKIKCDETKPSCSRCTTRALACSGSSAQPRLRWSRKHEILESRRFVSNEKSPPLSHREQESSPASWTSSLRETSDRGADNFPVWIEGIETRESGGRNAASDESEDILSGDVYTPYGVFEASGQPGSYAVDSGNEFYHHFMSDNGTTPESSATDSIGTLHAAQHSSSQDMVFRDLFIPQLADHPIGAGVDSSSFSGAQSASSCLTPIAEYVCRSDQGHLSKPLVDLPSELVEAYFTIVCPIFSTFDSEQNLFRSFVSRKWQHSVSMYHAIQSMAAAKLTWLMPDMKPHALEYRSLALKNLHADISRASSWTTELLFVVLMLGLSSCWHDITDLGLVHLKAMQHAIVNSGIMISAEPKIMDFFKKTLVYWEMVACTVNDDVSYHDYSEVDLPRPDPIASPAARIMPHPWTGIASEPQALFTRVIRHIRQFRSFERTPTLPSSTLTNPGGLRDAVIALETTIWAFKLPKLHDIANTGDGNTPAIHHLLVAEAYMFANLYQLYYVFPNLRRKRSKWLKEAAGRDSWSSGSWADGQINEWASILQQDEGTEKWVKFLGRNVIIRLEQIQCGSRTSCVQTLLLLAASGSLSVVPELEAPGSEEERLIFQARQFVLDRLAFVSAVNCSPPIQYVKSVVLEIFNRLDAGIYVFWMDVLQAMGVLTIIG